MRRGPGGGGAPTKAWRVSFVAALLAAPPILYFILRTAAVAMRPELAVALPPADNSPLLRPMLLVSADPRRRVAPQAVEAARIVARASPLAFEPFFILARSEEQAGRRGRATAMMEEARRRRPNFLLIHLQLLAYYQAANRPQGLLHELDFVLRRSEGARQLVYVELAKLARNPQGRTTLAQLLATNPSWRSDFLTAAQREPMRPADVLALIEQIRSIRPRADLTPERRLYVYKLAGAGEYRLARQLWLEMLPAAERPRNALVFDGSFRGLRAGPPFGWQFAENDSGRAVRSSSPGGERFLDVNYFGGATVPFAEQSIALPPGRYRIATRARSSTGITSGTISWNVTCLPGGPRLARLALASVREDFSNFQATFAVPAGCAAQRLQLIGEPGDVAANVDVEVAAVEIADAD